MLVHPSIRKDLITPWSNSYNDITVLDNFAQLQDEQLPPDLLRDPEQSLFHDQPPIESPFQSPFQSPSLQYISSSRPSSGSASPIFSSPTFSSTRSPATAVSSDFPPVLDGGPFEAPFMSVASSHNPTIHIQNSIPAPYPATQYAAQQFQSHSPMLAQQGIITNGHGWDSDTSLQLLSPASVRNGRAKRAGLQQGTAHKRAASGSSGKTGSNSPQTTSFGNHQHSSSFSPSGNLNGFAENYQNSSTSLPTPVQTPIQNSILAPAFQNYDPSYQNGHNVAAERAMRQAIMEQQQRSGQASAADDEASFHYSLAPSVSSLSHHDSPMTPQTTYDEFDDGSKAVVHDFNGPSALPMGVPKLNRTISDIYQDELYNTAIVPAQQARKPNPNQQLVATPLRSLFADRINAANQGHLSARSQSPANSQMTRERSPFRQGSPLAVDFRTARLQGSGFGSAMQLPHSNNMDMSNQQDNQGQPKTISPKDAVLEYHEGPDDTAMPSLFPSSQDGSEFAVNGDNLALRRQSTTAFQPTQPYSQMESFPNQYANQAAGLQQPFGFMQQPQQQNSRRTANGLSQPTPEFPASLPTIDSTASESAPAQIESRRPEDTSSDSGTYTCTYHGCTLRFETPAKLQKHKREAHRQTIPGQAVGRDHSTSLAMRNSQAGPHKCERINPSTGKPCNSIFSRPYDLTRHEDTIHNARKQKVRCHLCTEEKTFSRNDALTRHMRVVHPEVDWPGKQRRKGRD